MDDTTIILTCGDNYIYVCPYGERRSFVVDPTDATMVLRVLEEHRLKLAAILLTHHHGDHTAGVTALKSRTGCQVVGPDEQRIGGIDRLIRDGDTVSLDGLTAQVLATPGHTRSSVCYYLPSSGDEQPGLLFTGDTLFVGGCGRPMECDAGILWKSLTRLTALPDETLIFCGHDYTAENYEFALTIEPDNRTVREQLEETTEAARKGRPTVPSTIEREKATNIFLRATEPAVRSAIGMEQASPERVFAELRQRKNHFG